MLHFASHSNAPLVFMGELPVIQTDCFVPPPPEPQVTYITSQAFERVSPIHTEQLNEHWVLFCNTLAGGAPAVLNHSAVNRLNSFDDPRILRDSIDRQLVSAHLLAPMSGFCQVPQQDTTTLTTWLHITNACNLECPYCYIQKSGARMSFETGLRAVDAIFATARRHGFTAIKLKYAGGEAAMHYRLVQQIHSYAVERALEQGLELEGVVLSNGTVLPVPFVEWMSTMGIHLVLSVDGVGAIHDSQRPWKGGGTGSFALLERNLIERLLPRGIRLNLTITITSRNVGSVSEVVRWALHHELLFTLNFYREHSRSAIHRDLHYEEQQIIVGMLAAYAAIEQDLPTYPFLDGLLDHVQAQAHGHTCGAGRNYIVITHDGQVAQCQMELQHARPFGRGDDLLNIVASGPLHNIHVDDKEGCRNCPWRYRCAGGCPIMTWRATGRTDIKSPDCHIYQALLPAALRLEGLRILKARGYTPV